RRDAARRPDPLVPRGVDGAVGAVPRPRRHALGRHAPTDRRGPTPPYDRRTLGGRIRRARRRAPAPGALRNRGGLERLLRRAARRLAARSRPRRPSGSRPDASRAARGAAPSPARDTLLPLLRSHPRPRPRGRDPPLLGASRRAAARASPLARPRRTRRALLWRSQLIPALEYALRR